MKKYTINDIINLTLTGVIPILLFIFQLADYISWKYDIENDMIVIARNFMVCNQLCIIYIISNSYILKYCKYHRLMMWSLLAMYTLSDLMDYMSYQFYDLCINALFILGFYGFSVSIIKFINQIKRYEGKIKSINSSRRMC